MTRRVAAFVIALALTAVATALSIQGAGALEPIEDVVATTTSVVGEVVGAVTGDSTTTLVDEIVGEVTGDTTTTSSPSTTSTSTSTSTSTTTTATTTTVVASDAHAVSTTTIPRPAVRRVPPPMPEDQAAAPAPAPNATLRPVPVPALLHEPPRSLLTPPGPRSTLDVLALLEERNAPPYLVARVLAPFPVAGPAHYTDDWGAPRHGPPAHSHQGTDIFAPRGTPVVAAMDGTVGNMSTTSPLGGTSLRVTLESGTYFYYAHLDRFAPGLESGRRVRAGDVIGFVGNTGNAASTPSHLHFEIHPRGDRAAAPPVPYLDRWLAEATSTARAITGAGGTDLLILPSAVSDAVAEPTPAGPRRVSPLRVTPLQARPVAAVDPTPMLALAVVVALFSWLAQRGKRRAHRRIAGAIA